MEHRHTLSRVLIKWAGPDGRRKYESLSATKWILNRVLGECLIQHFYDWLHFAVERETADPVEHQFGYEILPYKYDHKTDFIVKVPLHGQKFEPIEFHYWDDRRCDKKALLNLVWPYGK
ncbi:hypothetical protein KCTCHS21_35020 [Cohnella abietis]|uniref:Uncharacterized protein n=2 Tax=Cohnella abietis TaxID=2507935 RepID=A0A3T1D7Q7_9BACL|nr:hypothetical protein KCTCHS21_35020 [Cohnella abietis]